MHYLCNQRDIQVRIKSIKGDCKYGFSREQKLNLSDIYPPGVCLHAFHTFYPYYLTLSNKGWFEWVKPGGGVFVNCPNPDGIIVKITLQGKVVDIRVVKSVSDCPFGYSGNDRLVISSLNFCPDALNNLYPYIYWLSYGKKIPWSQNNHSASISCPSYKNNVIFEVTVEP